MLLPSLRPWAAAQPHPHICDQHNPRLPADVVVKVLCRLAVAAEDRQSVRYSTLRNQWQGAARLGAVAASSCAAGLAIDTKQLVNVRDLADG